MASAIAVLAAGTALTTSNAAAESQPTTATVDAAAVAAQQLAYEAHLIDVATPRLAPTDADTATRVRTVIDALAPTMAGDLAGWGVDGATSAQLWDAAIGDGAPPPEEAQYTCSIRAQESNAEDLANTPPASLASELGTIELTLLLQGRQLAGQMDSDRRLAILLDQDQREALHALVPLLLSTDRSFAASA